MRRAIGAFAALVVVSMVFPGCSRSYIGMRSDMFHGRRALEQGDYAAAQQLFLKAAQTGPSPQAYAFAATAALKMNDLPNAERFVDEALRLDGRSDAHMRMLACRSLILFKEGRPKEGAQALSSYLGYSTYYPMPSHGEVRRMLTSGRIDVPRLEQLLDEEVRNYESDLAQYRGAGTGYFSQRYGVPVGSTVPEL